MLRLSMSWLPVCSVFPLIAAEVIRSGTGFAVTAEHIVTNAHVVAGCGKVTAKIGDVQLPAQTVSIDAQNDLALLKISGTFSTILALRDGTRVQLGEPVVAFGYPLQGLISTSLNMTAGNISALSGFRDDARLLQFTAPIQPGNSGGPLVDMSGNVIGVVTSKLSPLWTARMIGDVPQNVNFALKASVVRDFLESRGVEFQAQGLSATMPLTDLPAKVSGAILPLQCLGRAKSDRSESKAVSEIDPPEFEKRPGVLIAGYGSPAESFQFMSLELQNALAAFGVVVANGPSNMREAAEDSVSIPNLLSIVEKQGSDSLLYLTVVSDGLHFTRARVQCFDPSDKLLWEERASSILGWGVTEQRAALAVVGQLKKKLKVHIGGPGLPLR